MKQVLLPIWPETGAALGVGRTKVYELIGAGELRTVKIGRRRLVPVSSVLELVERLQRQASSAA